MLFSDQRQRNAEGKPYAYAHADVINDKPDDYADGYAKPYIQGILFVHG